MMLSKKTTKVQHFDKDVSCVGIRTIRTKDKMHGGSNRCHLMAYSGASSSLFLQALSSIYLCLRSLCNVGTEITQTRLSFQPSADAEARVMATLQRSARSFRSQGSSGLVWDDSLFSDQSYKNDKSDLKELRPCQSTKVIFTGMDFSTGPNNAAPPATCPRSLSSSGMNPSLRAYTRSLSGVFSKQQLVKTRKMGKTTDL